MTIDPIWLGVILCCSSEMGQISPPIGIIVRDPEQMERQTLSDVVVGTIRSPDNVRADRVLVHFRYRDVVDGRWVRRDVRGLFGAASLASGTVLCPVPLLGDRTAGRGEARAPLVAGFIESSKQQLAHGAQGRIAPPMIASSN